MGYIIKERTHLKLFSNYTHCSLHKLLYYVLRLCIKFKLHLDEWVLDYIIKTEFGRDISVHFPVTGHNSKVQKYLKRIYSVQQLTIVSTIIIPSRIHFSILNWQHTYSFYSTSIFPSSYL